MSKFSSGKRYITCGVESEMPLHLIMIIWELIDRKKEDTELDYLQIFTLSVKNGVQVIKHEQEKPKPFSKQYVCPESEQKVNEKIYVIDDGDHETMLLAREY